MKTVPPRLLIKRAAGRSGCIHVAFLAPGLPMSDIGQGAPRLLLGQGLTHLQKLDRDIVGGPHKSHATVAGGAIDCDAIGAQVLAHVVDVFDSIGEMPEVATVRGQTVVAVPIIGQLDGAVFLAGRGHEDQGKAALFTVVMAGFLEAQKLEEGHGFFQVFDADHGVKILDLHVAPRWMFQAHTIVATRAASRLKV